MKFIFSFILFFAFFIAPQTNGENKSFNRERTYDVQHYVIRLNFDRVKKIVYSDSTIQLKPLSNNFKMLVLDAQSLNFESVKLEQSGKDLDYSLSNGKIIIDLGKSFDKDELISVRFKYSINKPKKGIHFINPEKYRGKITRASQIWTQGESEETHYWLPSFDFPDDKATTEQFITVRRGETVISNGELLEQTENTNGTTTFHYLMPIPHSIYLTSFVIGKYVKVTEQYKNIPLSYYVYPNKRNLVPKAFGKTKDMLRIFEQLTGVDYPYNKYDQTMVADFQFGGMENITATTLADGELEFANFKGGQGLVEDLVSHELAHSWFGNLVTCRNWAELWLNESFATYMEAAFREKMYGRKDYIDKIEGDASEYFVYASLNENLQHALFNRTADPKNDEETLFTTINYQKGSAVIHTLREELGEQTFWKGINKYLDRYKYKNVETEDFQKVMEEVSDRDLDWFFKQWVYGNKFPILNIKQSYSPSSKQLRLDITQTQIGDKHTPKVFTLPLDVEISMPAGKKTEKILVKDREQIFKISVDEKPFKVAFDKGYKIPLKDISLSRLTLTK